MEATVILTIDDKEVSRSTKTLPPIHVKELELMAEINRRTLGSPSSSYMAQTLLVVSAIGLDVFMKEYGAHRLREQVQSMKEWLPK